MDIPTTSPGSIVDIEAATSTVEKEPTAAEGFQNVLDFLTQTAEPEPNVPPTFPPGHFFNY